MWPAREGRALQEIVARDFDVVVIPLCWRDLEVEEGRYQWEPVDRWIRWASERGKPVIAGLALGSALLLIQPQNVWLGVALGAAVYLGVLLAVRGIVLRRGELPGIRL